MEDLDLLNVVMWINIRVCLPFTALVIALCCLVRMDFVPIYYTNLLISNLIQLCTLIVWVAKWNEHEKPMVITVIYCCGGMASLGFRMCITLERYFSISCPLLQWIRQAKGFLLLSVIIWVFCVSVVPPLIVQNKILPLVIFGLLFAPVFIGCLTGTLKALPTATSMSAEEKRRTVGISVLLLLNYTLIVIPAVIWHISTITSLSLNLTLVKQVSLTLILSSPFIDLVLFVFMRKGPIDKLLACLCCCRMETTAADHQCE